MASQDIDLERERVACVFGLGGGEMHVADDRFPDSEGWDGPSGIAYWYDGVPEYVTLDELGLDLDDDVRTAILCCLFGHPTPPKGWQQVASYSSSGEAACWWCGTGNEDGGEVAVDGCKVCEGHGAVYLGDGWAEVVYRRVA